MKWYSLKKYAPLLSAELLIRCVEASGYTRYFVCSAEYQDDLHFLENWDYCNGAHHDLDKTDYTVTHFCIPDPVELE